MLGTCYGSSDVATEISHLQAADAAIASLRARGDGSLQFDCVWSSDLRRCRGLADALTPRLSGPVELRTDVRLRELDHGSFEGRAWEEIHESEPAALERWGARWRTEGPPRGESAEMLERRVSDWLENLDMTRRHLLVGHAGVMRAVLVIQQELDWAVAMAAEVPHLEALELT